ncbi:MAG TPA: c-type cytochrome [Edaphobacter sp.]|nr:c-type cytochrome [Edaphobacter sp.]
MRRTMPLLVLLLGALGCTRTPHDDAAKRGRDHMQYYGCVSCHTIPGVPGAHATVGPPLDRIGIQTYIAGTLPNTPEHLSLWIQHPQQIHPGTAMPELGVTPKDADDMARYLGELH